ncbi:hypothetical protein B7494_g359 [Chlorociboria aeruginascens]|nr:hypothetical protein B7494_g359 [Chlorociboria aeruginascens]
MPFDHPHTPQSPSQIPNTDLPPKPATSPRIPASLPTPAHSINGSMSSLSSENTSEAAPQSQELSSKRKRDLEDHGDREQKKVHVEDSRPKQEDLHLDVGKPYLLCRTPHPIVRPHPSQDLFDLYNLNGIAASVARVHPDGKKNTVRKTYKGYIKTLGLSGQFDSVKKEGPGSLSSLMAMPDEEWEAQNVRGKEIEKGLSDEVLANFKRAMTMSRGSIPKERWNKSVLGELVTSTPVEPPKPVLKTPIAYNHPGPRSAKDIPRPKRNVKKRTYGDSSFEGYGEGWVDEDVGQDAGYSTGDGEDRSIGRKRPKKTSTSHGFQGPMRQSSYGPGMVGA